VSHIAGTPYAFAIALGVVVVWAMVGPIFGFSNTWQLVINTGTTIVTFLMVFSSRTRRTEKPRRSS
jgi:low affinity Fe/Cu permease